MILTRTPMRISFAGGGSDLPAFCREEPGAVIGTTIQRYMWIAVSPKFDGGVRVSYSRTENVRSVYALQHDIARETLALYGMDAGGGIEVVSMADVPAGTGLGSSSAYAVGLANALHVYTHAGMLAGAQKLAETACDVEASRCKHPVGKQDQYFAAYGGLRYMTFEGDKVQVHPVKISAQTLGSLRERLMMLYLGTARDSGSILAQQQEACTGTRREATRRMVGIAGDMRRMLEAGNLDGFGEALHEAWMLKRELADGITSNVIDAVYIRALAAGATGGKVCGAGGGGFLLLYVPDTDPEKRDVVRCAAGLREVALRFERDGSTVVHCE